MVENSFLFAGVNTFAAFHTRHPRLSFGNSFFIDGKSRAGPNTFIALYASFRVNADIENINLVGKRLEGAHGTKQTALDSPFGQGR